MGLLQGLQQGDAHGRIAAPGEPSLRQEIGRRNGQRIRRRRRFRRPGSMLIMLRGGAGGDVARVLARSPSGHYGASMWSAARSAGAGGCDIEANGRCAWRGVRRAHPY